MGGKSMATSHLGFMIRTYLELRQDIAKHRPSLVGKMLEAMGDKKQARVIRDLGVNDRALVIGKDAVTADWTTAAWPNLFSDKKWEVRQIENLRRQINKFGLEVISKTPPNIDISTYHGSKGREADHLVLFTDCYPATWEEQEKNPDTETRLAYVGLTRARKNAIIIVPRTTMYLLALG